MPAKKQIDGAKLIKLIEGGTLQSEIMKEFGLNTSAQLKAHYVDALMESGKAPQIKSGRGQTAATPAKEAMVSKRGSVVIAKGLIEEMGFTEGDKFSVRKTKSGISLKKV
jgi:hypothetical protein